MFHWLVSVLLAAFPGEAPAAGAPPEAVQELPCSGYEQIRSELDQHYAEAPVSIGLQSNGHLLQLFASAGRATWTIVSLSPDGQACVVAAGSDWSSVQPAAGSETPLEEGV
jgi:hypothetical protein